MMLRTTTALAYALALGVATAATMAVPGAAIAAEKTKKQAGPDLSPAVRKPLAAAQTALSAKDAVTALARVAEARPEIKTADDRYYVSLIQYQAANIAQDVPAQLDGVMGMIDSGKADAGMEPKLYVAAAQLAHQLNDLPRAEQILDRALQANPSPDTYVYAAETKFKLKKSADAARLIAEVAAKGEASGAPVPEDWIKRGVAFAADAKNPAEATKLTRAWLRAYPSQTSWRDTLEIYRLVNTVEPELNLDFMRLQRAAGALRGERDYFELAEATYVKLPGEAKAVLDQGIANGALDPAKSRAVAELRTIASSKVAADKASLSKNSTTGRGALGMADAYASYGDYASAVEMYRKALTLGGIDANTANVRLASALAMSGKKDEAKALLATITGPRADLAAYWTIFIDHPPAAN